jgi:hypothetical protein
MGGTHQSREEIHGLVRAAIGEQRAISAMYHGQLRRLCPHVLGWNKQGRLQVLCYQYGEGSQSGLRIEDGSANWRCTALEGFRDVEPQDDPWQTAEFVQPQTCVEQIEMAVEGWPTTTRNRDRGEVAEAGGGQS